MIRIPPSALSVFIGVFLAAVLVVQSVQANSPTVMSPKLFSELDKFAQFSNVAYAGTSAMQQISQQWGYAVTDSGQLEGLEVRYFLATNHKQKTHIIAVRGTANSENAAVNFVLKLNSNNVAGIPLHTGFSTSAQGIYTAIKEHVKPNYEISLTGHSLGGGVAVILAMYLDTENYKIGKVITFGQPKVTNVHGANLFEHLNILRVVTPKDIIPLLPPFDPVAVPHRGIYWHLGTEIVLLGGDEYSMLAGVKSMLRATKFFNRQPDESNINNHQMSIYAQLIDQKREHATLVPYQSDFSFVGNLLQNIFD